MGIWIELFVFSLVFLFAWHQLRDLKKEKEKRARQSDSSHKPLSVARVPVVTPAHLTIATRESRLALWQAHHVKDRLTAQGHQVVLLGMTTQGDQILDVSLSKVGGKGLFVKELETALLDGRADLAVHSLKDVPMELPPGLVLACVMAREDPRDAWVSPHYPTLMDLPQGAVVGTSSLRRQVLLRALRPDIRIEPLRGNLDTRLQKLDLGHYDGIVLAAAGLKRLGLSERIRSVFSVEEMPPAAGQGALGIETVSQPGPLQTALMDLNDPITELCTTAERAVSRTMGGSCSMPLAAHAQCHGQEMHIHAVWGDPEQVGHLIHARASQSLDMDHALALSQVRALGESVAARLQAQGAG
jgi:hydroxymethylbilane synthase